MPGKRRQARVPESDAFNQLIAMDVLVVRDAKGESYKVLSIVDVASRYHVAVVLKDSTSCRVKKNWSRDGFLGQEYR